MISKQRALLNICVLASLLFFGLLYSALFHPGIPNSIIIPTIGGGLMNLGFWFFYKSTFAPIPELSKSIIGKRTGFLFVSFLHLIAISLLLIFDISWIFELF
ncbi:hypothetical protein KKB44_00735 [Candidatus Micrarchaeota archaeon]|nr:hypothetical protein [Candidatus Micrarchaeota archaeon]